MYLTAWTLCHRGWQLTVYSWTTRRQKRSSVHLLAVNTSSWPHLFESAVQPVTAARNLGIYLVGDVSMRTHVTTTVRACFAMLCQIRSVRHSLPRPALLTILRSLVINKLDSCSSVMASASDVLLPRLQSVLNAAVRLVFSARKFDHTTPLLCEIHWLKVPERVKFQSLAVAHVVTSDPLRYQLYWCVHASFDLWRQVIPGGCRMGMECPTATCSYVPSLPNFRRELKTVLFQSSFPGAIRQWTVLYLHAHRWYVTMFWLLQTDSVNTVRWSCSSSAIIPP